MLITLSPVRMSPAMILVRHGDVLIIDGEVFDFSALPEGAYLPPEAMNAPAFTSGVERVNGVLVFTLRLPHGANAPEATRFPEAILVTQDGPVTLPPYDEETPDGD